MSARWHRALAVGAVLLAGATWSLFCQLLAHGAHAPSRTFVPIAPADYYRAQSLFVVPLLLLQWLFCSWLATRVAQVLGGRGDLSRTLDLMGPMLALPLVLLFLLPDLIVFEVAGFRALGKLVRFTAPASFAVTLLVATLGVRRVHELSWPRASLAACAGVLGQALMGAPLLR